MNGTLIAKHRLEPDGLKAPQHYHLYIQDQGVFFLNTASVMLKYRSRTPVYMLQVSRVPLQSSFTAEFFGKTILSQ